MATLTAKSARHVARLRRMTHLMPAGREAVPLKALIPMAASRLAELSCRADHIFPEAPIDVFVTICAGYDADLRAGRHQPPAAGFSATRYDEIASVLVGTDRSLARLHQIFRRDDPCIALEGVDAAAIARNPTEAYLLGCERYIVSRGPSRGLSRSANAALSAVALACLDRNMFVDVSSLIEPLLDLEAPRVPEDIGTLGSDLTDSKHWGEVPAHLRQALLSVIDSPALSPRTRICMRRNWRLYYNDICNLTEAEFLRMPGAGRFVLTEMRRALKRLGLAFRSESATA